MDNTRKIVSSNHLADGDNWQMSEFEYGLIVAFNGFNRWIGHCMSAAGNAELGPLEILVLHNINHRKRAKKLADVCFMLNIEDTHTVNYALKKLIKADLIAREKSGKEMYYSATEAGIKLCDEYRKVRAQCLIDQSPVDAESLREIAANLRALSGMYDQASRAAASL